MNFDRIKHVTLLAPQEFSNMFLNNPSIRKPILDLRKRMHDWYWYLNWEIIRIQHEEESLQWLWITYEQRRESLKNWEEWWCLERSLRLRRCKLGEFDSIWIVCGLTPPQMIMLLEESLGELIENRRRRKIPEIFLLKWWITEYAIELVRKNWGLVVWWNHLSTEDVYEILFATSPWELDPDHSEIMEAIFELQTKDSKQLLVPELNLAKCLIKQRMWCQSRICEWMPCLKIEK